MEWLLGDVNSHHLSRSKLLPPARKKTFETQRLKPSPSPRVRRQFLLQTNPVAGDERLGVAAWFDLS